MPAIVVSNVTKKFGGKIAVDNISFSVDQGEVFGLLGPNGAGKTTTIRMLTTLISPTEGSASVGGFDINQDPLKIRENVGILTETPCLYERMSAYENLDFFAQAYGVSDPIVRKERINNLLEFFGLFERRNDKVAGFSKGMKQKLAIARALVHKPAFLFLDEPTSGLDPASAKEIRDLISKLSKQEKRTVLLSTHHLEDAEKLAGRVLIINQGEIVAIGKPGELQEKTSGSLRISVELFEVTEAVEIAAKDCEEIISLEKEGDKLILTLKSKESVPEVIKALSDVGGKIYSIVPLRASLEEAYLKLVGAHED